MSDLTPLPLLDEVRLLIKSARERAAIVVDAELMLLYWPARPPVSAPKYCAARGPSTVSR